jgi:hypothetical protein
MNVKETGCKDWDSTELVQDRVQRQAFVSTIINFSSKDKSNVYFKPDEQL